MRGLEFTWRGFPLTLFAAHRGHSTVALRREGGTGKAASLRPRPGPKLPVRRPPLFRAAARVLPFALLLPCRAYADRWDGIGAVLEHSFWYGLSFLLGASVASGVLIRKRRRFYLPDGQQALLVASLLNLAGPLLAMFHLRGVYGMPGFAISQLLFGVTLFCFWFYWILPLSR